MLNQKTTGGEIHLANPAHHVFTILDQKFIIDMPMQAFLLALVGAIVLARFVVSWITFLAETFAFGGSSLKSFGAKEGKWAVVTGCTSGIGESFAKQLGKAGFNVLLVSRNKQVLDQLAQEIGTKYKVQTKFVAVDLADKNVSFAELESAIQSIDVGVLVNNAGVSHYMPVPFAKTPDQELANILQVNINSVLAITKIVLPKMIETQNGLILNIGSFGARVPSPLLATYSASKAFLATWTKAIGEEVKDDGITVRLIVPSFVVSKMSKIRQSSPLVPTPDAYVRSVLSSIGLNRGAQGRAYESTPFWTHALMDYVVGFIPESIAIWYNLRLHKDIRQRALRKQQREKAKSQ
ncbi:hypothetical protein NliqN6_2872 [Naganishia liquefaciens]|uniref:Very-long-chain 3-oxoacyl-CoA reductase n=1 Tax=Naganishia liquefaciens TaxID=104408 RepID=A0A8H3YEE3_9TREE|nr:hypothetical protein NliqN6_2872 [Naganishia liquefaciens]